MKRLLPVLVLAAGAAWAVEPGEMLGDPALEARAREISKEVRCLVCRNESIDGSNAELARDLRLLVRERILEGDTDEEVMDHLVDRYGEYVLLNPRADGANLILWAAGPAMLILGLMLALTYLRRRAGSAPSRPLTAEEKAEIDELMRR